MTNAAEMPARATTITLRVEPMGWLATAAQQQTVLLAALEAHIELPNACRNGTCRSCLSSLLSGEIRYLIDWPGVSAEERQEGLFLPCVACALTDIVINQPLATMRSTLNVT